MPKPVIGPCGGENEPPCPPVPATPVQVGDVLVVEGTNFVVSQEETEQNEGNEDTAA